MANMFPRCANKKLVHQNGYELLFLYFLNRFFCFVLFFLVTREGPHPPRTCLIFVLGKDEKLNWEVTGLKLKSRGHTQNCMLFFWFSKIKKLRPALELKR